MQFGSRHHALWRFAEFRGLTLVVCYRISVCQSGIDDRWRGKHRNCPNFRWDDRKCTSSSWRWDYQRSCQCQGNQSQATRKEKKKTTRNPENSSKYTIKTYFIEIKKEKDQYLINCAHRIGFQTDSITRRRAIAIGYRVVVHFISIRTPS